MHNLGVCLILSYYPSSRLFIMFPISLPQSGQFTECVSLQTLRCWGEIGCHWMTFSDTPTPTRGIRHIRLTEFKTLWFCSRKAPDFGSDTSKINGTEEVQTVYQKLIHGNHVSEIRKIAYLDIQVWINIWRWVTVVACVVEAAACWVEFILVSSMPFSGEPVGVVVHPAAVQLKWYQHTSSFQHSHNTPV